MQVPIEVRCLTAALSCIAGCSAAQMQGLTPSQTEAIEQFGEQALDDGIVGLSIAIAKDGSVVFASGFGHSDLERSIPATEHTIYDIASVGKQFTAAGILRLVDEGRLSLDDQLRDYVPETPSNFPDATIRELLNHTSGFIDGDLDELNPPPGIDQRKQGLELLDDPALMQGKVVFQPSEHWHYCNPGYLLLGLVIEAASGKAYQDFLYNDLLLPAGISSMTVCQRPDSKLMSDSLHRTQEGVSRVPVIHMSAYGGQGSICSSVVDLLAWEEALDSYQIISPAGMHTFRSPARIKGNDEIVEIPYGTAQRMGTLAGHRKVGHSGTYEGGSAVLAYYPDDKLTIAVATNTRGNGTPHAMAVEHQIAMMILGITHDPIESLRQPLTDTQCSQINGSYQAKHKYEARATSDGALQVFKGDKLIETTVHTGGLVFRDESKPTVIQWFIMDGERAGYWVYENNAFMMEVLKREPY